MNVTFYSIFVTFMPPELHYCRVFVPSWHSPLSVSIVSFAWTLGECYHIYIDHPLLVCHHIVLSLPHKNKKLFQLWMHCRKFHATRRAVCSLKQSARQFKLWCKFMFKQDIDLNNSKHTNDYSPVFIWHTGQEPLPCWPLYWQFKQIHQLFCTCAKVILIWL